MSGPQSRCNGKERADVASDREAQRASRHHSPKQHLRKFHDHGVNGKAIAFLGMQRADRAIAFGAQHVFQPQAV